MSCVDCRSAKAGFVLAGGRACGFFVMGLVDKRVGVGISVVVGGGFGVFDGRGGAGLGFGGGGWASGTSHE